MDSTTTDLDDTVVLVDLSAGTATCFLSVLTPTGSVIDSDTGSTSSTVAGANIDFAAVSVTPNSDSHAALRCVMPVNGRIISYVVEEN